VLAAPLAVIAYAARLVPNAVLTTTTTWPIWMRASAAMVVGEIGYYWGHRLSHEAPFLWRFHAIYHSAEQIDFLVSTRAHPVDFVFTRICMLAPLYALGLVGTVHVTDGAIAWASYSRASCGDTSCMQTCGGGSVRWNGSSRRQVSTTGTTPRG
jgi:sterol desaturase/sphingolipid hydroxylase (fatty acid hydroxylase superfamily)